MEALRNLADATAVWIDFNIDSTAILALMILVIVVACAFAAVLAITIARRSAAAELAHYGGSARRLKSFVCEVCLHRSYAESHIRRRYCARCDKTYPETPKVLKLQEAGSGEYPAGVSRIHYRGLNEPKIADRTHKRA